MIRNLIRTSAFKSTSFLHQNRARNSKIIISKLLFSTTTNEEKEMIHFYFQENKSGDLIKVKGEVGKSVLDVALEYNVDIEGACGGNMACSTCHCVLSQDLFDALPKKEEEEQDMLDLALGLTDT